MPGMMPQSMEPSMRTGSPDVKTPEGLALTAALEKLNLADGMEGEKLAEISDLVVRGYELDRVSRQDWLEDYEKALKLAMQVVDVKSYPWPKASNIKFPVLSIAAFQFGARAYPSLIPSDGTVVKHRVIGKDHDGRKRKIAKCVSELMSWQVMEQMDAWEEDFDRLLLMLPVVGIAFKKTYWDEIRQKPCSELVHARDLIVNYWAKDLESAERKTQEYYMTKRQIDERIRSGEYRDLETWPDPSMTNVITEDTLSKTFAPAVQGADTPFLVLEQHTFYDLDGDGYPEPVIITVMHQNQHLLRISPRWDSDAIIEREGKLVRIVPTEYYTKFSFFPNPDGGFYDIGFGSVLGPINESINTIINQLVDAGTLANMQGGFISKGLRVKNGDYHFSPGEWKQVESAMDDLRKGVLPHQYKEPSAVLMNLLGVLHQSARELSSVSEIMTGKMPGQNTPAYTTKETVEQGQKVFTAVYKRIFRSMTREFRKLYRLDQLHLPIDVIASVTDAEYAQDLFQGDPNDIVPAADPQAVSAGTKSAQAQQLIEMVKVGAVPNPPAAFAKVVELLEMDLDPAMMQPPPPRPDPKVEADQKKLEAEMQMRQQEMQAEQKMKQEEHQMKMQMLQAELQFKQQEMQMEMQLLQAKLQFEMQKLGLDQQRHQFDMQAQAQQGQIDMAMADQDMQIQQKQGAQKMELADKQHKQKLKQSAEKPKPTTPKE